jgi:HK97 family phage portal protein
VSFWSNLFSRDTSTPLRAAVSKEREQRATVTNGVPVSDSAGLSSLFNLQGMSIGGVTVTEASALTFAAVWACVLAISQDIAALPCQLYRETAFGKEKVLTHPASRLLNLQANPLINAMPFRQAMTATVLLHGNAYARIERDGLQYATRCYYYHPSQTTVFKGDDGQLYYLFAGDGKVYPSSEVIHLRGMVLDPSGILGKSVLRVAAETVGQALAAQRTGSQFYKNGARLSGVLQTKETFKDGKAAERIRNDWQELYGGSENAGKVAVLENGLQFKTVNLPPADAQFLEARKYSWSEVCAFFRVPPHKTGDLSRSTNNNIEQQSIDYVQNTLTPWVVNFEQEYRLKLLRTDEVETCSFKHNLAALLRADSAARGEYYGKMLQNGVYSINEVRRMEELNDVDGGDRRYVQVNLMPIDRVDDVINNNQAKKAAKTEPVA